jgi:hypothetical protein
VKNWDLRLQHQTFGDTVQSKIQDKY